MQTRRSVPSDDWDTAMRDGSQAVIDIEEHSKLPKIIGGM